MKKTEKIYAVQVKGKIVKSSPNRKVALRRFAKERAKHGGKVKLIA